MRSLLFVLLLIISNFAAKAQRLRLDSLEKRSQAVYAELLGAGGIFSANYESRFKRQADGLGMRVGLSYLKDSGTSLFTLPVQFNYLLGKDEKYFEIGLGATYSSEALNLGDSDDTGPSAFGTMCFGYRQQPKNSGFMFRAGLSPVFGKDFFIPYFPHISFGYSF